MFRIERINPDGSVDLMMTSPHRVGIDDLYGPPRSAVNNQMSGAFYLNDMPTPGSLSVFSGKEGSKARVRWNDVVFEEYEWHPLVPVNPRDPDTDYLWGWRLTTDNRGAVPFEELHPVNVPFVG